MSRFPCPYLKSEVELTEERECHIAERHPDLLPEHRERVAETLGDPDQVRRYLFSVPMGVVSSSPALGVGGSRGGVAAAGARAGSAGGRFAGS